MQKSDFIQAASLSNPFYYLENALTVWQWVLKHHCDCLCTEEIQQLQDILNLPRDAQALLVRMVMRQGELFPLGTLQYAEIENTNQAVALLKDLKLIEMDPLISLDEAYSKFNKEIIWTFCHRHFPVPPKKSERKDTLYQRLKSSQWAEKPRTAQDWGDTDHWIRLRYPSFYKRIQLMFFGNLAQDWSEFIVTELGHIKYESISYQPELRAFTNRSDIDRYLHFDDLQADTENTLLNGADTLEIDPLLLSACHNRWLEAKRKRVCFKLAQLFEKNNLLKDAVSLYDATQSNTALVRQLRLMERYDSPESITQLAQSALKAIQHSETSIYLQRILHRQQRKLGLPVKRAKPIEIPELLLHLPASDYRVENAVAHTLSTSSSPVYYVENRLIPSLWALLFWEAIYAPIKGAFLHPFQSAPLDIYSKDFFQARANQLSKLRATIVDGSYQAIIRHHYHKKHSLQCPFIHWPSLSEELINLALDNISSEQLRGMFDYLEQDLRQHKRGMPDLIQFMTEEKSIRFIEVKAPNDRLQTSQNLWLEALIKLKIESYVAKVTWQS